MNPGAQLNRALMASSICVWVLITLQVLLFVACREGRRERCGGGTFFVWLVLPQALFSVVAMRARGVSWRFSLAPLQAEQLGTVSRRAMLPLGVGSGLMSGVLVGLALRGLARSSAAAAALYLCVAAAAGVCAAADLVVLRVQPLLEESERQFSLTLLLPPDEDLKL